MVDPRDDEGRLVLLPRDPLTIFAYWQLSAAASALRARQVESGAGMLRDALRVEASEDSASSAAAPTESWVVMLPPLSESCYVALPRPHRTVKLVLGLTRDGTGFTPLMASAALAMPESGWAAIEPPRWRRLGSAPDDDTDGPPALPPRGAVELLFARAAESEHATSDIKPPGHHVQQLERDVTVAPGY